MDSSLEICGLKVERENRNKGTLWAGPYFYPPENQKIRKYAGIPFTVVRGAYDGPILCITAGVHPTEYTNIAALIRLSNEIDPKKLKGTLIAIPVVNTLGFAQREYVNPVDGLNLQGNWPGKTEYEGGTISHLILHRVFTDLVSKADYYLDLHGSDIHESMLPSASFYKTGNSKIDEKSEGMARATGVKYISFSEGSEGVGSSQRVMAEKGIPSALFECDGGDRMLQQDVESSFQSLVNVLRYLKMLEGKPHKTRGQMMTVSLPVRVSHDGLLYLRVKLGDSVSEGQVLGIIKDLFGNVIETVYAPTSGMLTSHVHNPKVEIGEIIMWLRRPRPPKIHAQKRV